MLRIKTGDNYNLEVEKDLVCKSILINNMLNDLEVESGEIPIPNVNSKIMKLFIEYARLHQNDTKPNTELPTEEQPISDADKEFLKMDHQTLLDLMNAANYLDYPQLLNLCCKELGNRLIGMSIPEVQTEFNIPKEDWYTEEELALIEQEEQWVNS